MVPEGEVEGFLPKLLSCVWCLSVWTSGISYGIYQVAPVLVIILAASSVAILVERYVR